jgi:hypothetical protein
VRVHLQHAGFIGAVGKYLNLEAIKSVHGQSCAFTG